MPNATVRADARAMPKPQNPRLARPIHLYPTLTNICA